MICTWQHKFFNSKVFKSQHISLLLIYSFPLSRLTTEHYTLLHIYVLVPDSPLSILYLSHWPLCPAKRKSFYLSYLTAFEEWKKSLGHMIMFIKLSRRQFSFSSLHSILVVFWVLLTILKQYNVDCGAYCEELLSYTVKFSFPSQVWWTSIKLIPKAGIKV